MNEPSPETTSKRPSGSPPTESTTDPNDPLGPTLTGVTPSASQPYPIPGPGGLPVVPRYELVRELGRGGMGVVYEARQTGLNRTVALKMILAGAHAGPDAVARFRAEAEAVARVRHANIVQIYDIDEVNGLPFFALEFVPGGTLERRLADGPLPVDEAVRVAERLADAVAAAHAAGIVHRDLKPANVLLAPDGTPKVTDFGLAKSLEADEGRTVSGTVLGTPNYMAPEQAEGRGRDVGPHTDVWAIGAVLYALLTGTPPFKGDSTVKTLDNVRFKAPAPPRRLRAEVSPGLEAVCLKCLAKTPADRYPDAAALAADLARVRDGLSPLAADRPRRSGRVWIAAAVLLVAVGTAVAVASRPRTQPPEPGGEGTDTPPAAQTPVATDRPPARFALLVGVREYRGPDYNVTLQYTEQDVNDFARVLNDRGFERRNISVLTQWNQADSPALAPSAANIRKRLKAMGDNCRPGDTVVVALTGHGSQTGDPPQFYFWPAGGNPRDPESLISQQEMYAAFDRCRADVKLLLVDACREFPKDGKFDLKVRGGPLVPKQPDRFAAFYSCSPGQVCWELDRYKHGIFFHHLIEAFRGGADADRDGLVSLNELVTHAATGVKGNKQEVEQAMAGRPFSYQIPELVGDLPKATPIGGKLTKSAVAPPAPPAGPSKPNVFGD